jgi:uncharacterized protein YprB with RNaseH-like and TPR domain
VEKQQRKRSDLRAQLDRLGYGAGKAKPKVVPVADLRRVVRKQTSPQKQASTATDRLSDTIHYSRELPRHHTPRRRSTESSAPVMLEEALNGRETCHPERGRFYLLTTDVANIENGELLNTRFPSELENRESGLCDRLRRSVDPEMVTPQDIVFMDIETTGLSSSPLFLIGIMTWEPGGFQVHQFFARNYAEEAAVIAAFLDRCLSARLLVTFNGKTYDYPYIRNRAAANGVPFTLDLVHVDLLHESRRIWKHELPDCKLQTLESRICGRDRVGDIPGSEIPEAYHNYVRTNNGWQMVNALEHNMLDLVTLADIMTHFPRVP